MSGWRRRTLWSDDDPFAIAKSAVSDGPLYALWRVRGLPGGERIVAHLHGCGTGYGPWTDRMLDLSTGQEFDVSSEDEHVEARRITLSDLPPALRALWPKGPNGKPIPPGCRDNGPEVGPTELRKLAGKADLTPPQTALF